jgi:rhodanese-related sulfurtransferase/predicted small secreted protein
MKRSQPLVLATLSLALALAACGGEAQPSKAERKAPGGAPFGFELAAAAAGEVTAPLVAELSPDDVAAELARGTIRLIDIRTPEEVADGGTIAGAEHIPMDQLDASVLAQGDGREVVLYCRSGSRSLAAATQLAEQSGQSVTHMAGGILGWRERDSVRLAACNTGTGQAC